MKKLILSLFLGMACLLQAAAQDFSLPQIPDTLRTPSARASYLVAHYWDDFSFADSLQYMDRATELEQAVVNYVDLFRLVSPEEVTRSLTDVMQQASVSLNGLYFFYNIFEKYLYDLASPMRNETWFIPVLEQMKASPRLSADDKIRPTMLLESVLKNRVGSVAADFTYTLADGTPHMLHSLPSEQTLLLFFDPECDECHALIEALSSDEALNRLITAGKLSVLAVYPGENLRYWKTMQSHMPKNWTVAYDASQQIYGQALYEILGFPALYLLDKDKKVLLKDTSLEKIHEILHTL